jgi:hypothetical protein
MAMTTRNSISVNPPPRLPLAPDRIIVTILQLEVHFWSEAKEGQSRWAQ